MAVLVDTSGLIALIDNRSSHHRAVRGFVQRASEPLLVPVTVLPEADYLLTKKAGPRVALALLRSIAAGEFRMEGFGDSDLARAIELVARYLDSDIGLVDASIVAIAERRGITRLLTLDHRHFGLIRPRHCDSFTLLPTR